MTRVAWMKPLILVLVCLGWRTVEGRAQTAVMVDTRLMVMAHPLTQAFDPATRRFRGTSSEPLADGETAQAVEGAIASLTRQLASLQAAFGEEMKRAAGARREELEKTYLERRHRIEAQLSEQRERRFTVEEVPLRPGMTGYDAILPQIQTISKDLRTAIRRLREASRAVAVIDVSALFPLYPPQGNPAVLGQNCHFYFWRNTFPNKGNISQEWMLQAKRYWALRDPQLTPVPYGALDMRLEAARLMTGGGNK